MLNQARDNIEEALQIAPNKPAIVNAHLAEILYRRARITQNSNDYKNAISSDDYALEVGDSNKILDTDNGKAYNAQAKRYNAQAKRVIARRMSTARTSY